MEKFNSPKTPLPSLDLLDLDAQEEKIKELEQEIILGMLGIWNSSEVLGITLSQHN